MLCVVIFAIFIARLFSWQIVQGSEYRKVSNIAAAYSVTTDAVRGEILDKNGTPLAINEASFDLIIDKLYLKKDSENEVTEYLLTILEQLNIKWNDKLPITINENGKYAFIPDTEDEIEFMKSKDMLNMNFYSSAEECMNKLTQRYSLDKGILTDTMRKNIVGVRYTMERDGYNMTTPFTFAEDLNKKNVAIISEKTQGYNGIQIRTKYKRSYKNGDLAPHIVGTVGKLTAEEYDELKNDGYSYNDSVGKNGIEYGMEKYLRGTSGTQLLTRNADGSVIQTEGGEVAKPGNTVYLTIDAELQKVANKSLAKNVKAAREYGKSLDTDNSGEDCFAGAAVVLNVKDFSVLATATYPSYNLEKYSDYDYYSKLINDKNTPLFNRAFNGAYAPGSIFKCCVTAAALEESVIKTSTAINCTHIYDYYKADPVRCMGTHGVIELFDAMASSCNYYFAEVGRLLGIDAMYLYAERFGLGVRTGVEMYESEGTLAGRDNNVWHEANTVKAAIGQSDNAFTPLQLATYAATIANNGTRLKTHLVDKVVSYDRKTTVYENSENNPVIEAETGISKKNMDSLKKAMRQVVTSTYGTANSVFGDYEIDIAAKTGTAENSGSDHVTFICFAPFEKPEIAVAVVLEHGAKGAYSMSVAKDIMDAYFNIDRSKNTDTDTDTQ